MKHEIPPHDLKDILAALREDGNPRRRWIADQLEGVDITERIKGYDPPEEFKQYIRDICHYLKAQFNLEDWSATITFCAIPQDPYEEEEVQAQVHVNEIYLFYVIKIGRPLLDFWHRAEYEMIGRAICHEFCHILLHPVGRLALLEATPSQKWLFQETIERQNQRFTVVIASALPDDWWLPERLAKWKLRYPEYNQPPKANVVAETISPNVETKAAAAETS